MPDYDPEDALRFMQLLNAAIARGEVSARRIDNTTTTFEEALLDRLEALTAQLAPLRELSPSLEAPRDKVQAELQLILQGLARPDWSNATRLDTAEQRELLAKIAGGDWPR